MTFDWSFVQRYAPFFVNGTLMTLFISVFGILLAIAVGLVCAGVEIARIPVARQIVRIYIELSRNTPLLVQLYFLYFGLPKLGVVWSAETCAIVGLGFLGGSYMAEAMRGGLEAVPNVQRETAYVLGLTSTQTITRVILPQAVSTAIPGVVANVIFLFKESSVVSAIALADVMYMAKDLIGMYYGAEILLQPGVFPRLLQGLWVTVWIAGVSVGASIPVGLLVGWLMTLKNPVIRAAMRIYLDFIRIMPQLALLFLAYYGFARWFDWNLDATGACVLVFILWGGAELGDLVRGALQSIPKVQYESSYVLGLSPWQTFSRVILPQAVRRMLPASVNLATRIVKTTSLAVLLGVVEVIKVGQQIIDANRFQFPTGTLWIYGVIFFMYFIVCWPLSIVARRLEKRWSND